MNKEKIILALGNKKYAEIIKRTDRYEIIGQDIQYKEGILERLELKEKIDTIIINKKIPGKIKIEEIIKYAEKRKIKIFIIKNKKEIKAYLKNTKINKIIAFVGTGGVGKSTIIYKIIKNNLKNKKCIIINLDKKDNSFFIIFNSKRTKEKIIKIRNNCYYYNGYFYEKEIKEIKEKYEKILLEIHNEKEYKILKSADEIYLVIENNKITIDKSIKILKKLKKIGINKKNIKIILNKRKLINSKNIKNIFSNYQLIKLRDF